METKHQALAAHFEECARLLRAHPELFADPALEQVGIVAGLSTRVVRLAARGRPLAEIMRDVAGLLLQALVRAAWPVGGSPDRPTLEFLAGVRRGYLRAVERAMLLERRRLPLYTLTTAEDGAPTITSPCPHCGDVATRDLHAPAPCQPCGYLFEAIAKEA